MNAEEKKLAFRVLFGEKLEEARANKGMSQEDVAKLTGLSRSVISYYESGKRSINLNEAIFLCDRCGFDFTHIASEITSASPADLAKALEKIQNR